MARSRYPLPANAQHGIGGLERAPLSLAVIVAADHPSLKDLDRDLVITSLDDSMDTAAKDWGKEVPGLKRVESFHTTLSNADIPAHFAPVARRQPPRVASAFSTTERRHAPIPPHVEQRIQLISDRVSSGYEARVTASVGLSRGRDSYSTRRDPLARDQPHRRAAPLRAVGGSDEIREPTARSASG